jgi:hypothetical protein
LKLLESGSGRPLEAELIPVPLHWAELDRDQLRVELEQEQEQGRDTTE